MKNEILNGVLAEFEKLAAIPRPSKHEEKISNFLKDYLAGMGFEVVQDSYNNLIATIPATVGKENAPTTILQAHIDMVCVAEDGYNYNPMTDAIKLIRTEDFLTAEGTSLGADDGIGVAEILYIAKQSDKFSHGAIKIIFTTDEEQGMSGAINLDAKYLQGADFLINCDSENWDFLTVGSAGSVRINFTRQLNFVVPEVELKNAFKIKISGLKGGHSGVEIGFNRANAIRELKNFLNILEERGEFQIAKIAGGAAANVIPSTAEILICTGLAENILSDCAEIFKAQFKQTFGDGESDFKFEISKVEMPEKIFCEKDCFDLLNLLELIHTGVYAMNRDIPNLVESSANLAVICTEENNLTVNLFSRSNVYEMLKKFIKLNRTLARLTDFEIDYSDPSPAWTFNPHSKLIKIMTELFTQQNKFQPTVQTIHAGLECGFFLQKNPALDMISIGTTNEGIHSPQEKLHLKTVAPQVYLIVGTLVTIAAADDELDKIFVQ